MKSSEIYGFVGWVASFVLYGIYLIWAFIPDRFLQSMGITFYPNKHWALAFPCLFCVTLIFFQFVVQGLHMSSTKPLTSIYLMQDEHTKFCSPHDERADGLPDIYDIPVNVVNNALFYDRHNNPKFYNKNK